MGAVLSTESEAEADNEILQWKAPEYMTKTFPYYLSGYDYDGAPVWIIELGHWDVRSIVEGGDSLLKEFDRYVDQGLAIIKASGQNNSTDGYVLIIDGDGYGLRQASNIRTVYKMIDVIRKFANDAVDGGLKYAFAINVNYVAENMWGVLKPTAASLTRNFEVFGTNSKVWVPKLLKQIPKDQLPEIYGGSKDHLPIKIYG
ncbi:unnamed protein product [Allacma fusca]|uniref:CRAL-TRIO domain-containing protein n=1 Tax=Allacma fusca TaxID=39272 RepID=A0A8J2PJR1_9HEXA|nr:unnamed protein product [Allacma fusca]